MANMWLQKRMPSGVSVNDSLSPSSKFKIFMVIKSSAKLDSGN